VSGLTTKGGCSQKKGLLKFAERFKMEKRSKVKGIDLAGTKIVGGKYKRRGGARWEKKTWHLYQSVKENL